tara:strand:- start:805 stop:2205 length:1401 start_codon:yes stop_codon:yes gene_type:complete
MRDELVVRGGWDWMMNPIFLSLEILLIDWLLVELFLIENPNVVGFVGLILFALIYRWFDFSSQTKLQAYMIGSIAFVELVVVFSELAIDRTLIQYFLCASLLMVGIFHICKVKIVVIGEVIHARDMFGSQEFNLVKTSVEVREPGISALLRTGELILRGGGEIFRISGLNRPELLRRRLIDEWGAIPHFQRASWAGTLWIFLFLIVMIVIIESTLFIVIYWLLPVGGVALAAGSLGTWFVVNMCILNVRIPRYPHDPAGDLRHQNKIADGMWTEIFHEKDGWVTKQLFRCGWGHNDYVRHRVPVVGSKICGKWNPLALVIIHAAMLVYQMIGIKRRIIYQDFVRALPKTRLEFESPYRYSQEWVPNKFIVENVPSDARAQMSELQEDLVRVGLSIDDMHAGNFRINDHSKILAIDGELYTDGEVFLKNLLVLLFDGRQVKGMTPVLGCTRIVRWVDHRPSVDDIVG